LTGHIHGVGFYLDQTADDDGIDFVGHDLLFEVGHIDRAGGGAQQDVGACDGGDSGPGHLVRERNFEVGAVLEIVTHSEGKNSFEGVGGIVGILPA